MTCPSELILYSGMAARLSKLISFESLLSFACAVNAPGVVAAIPDPIEGEENFVGDSEIIALGGASNETKDRPLG